MRYTVFIGGQTHDVDIQRQSERVLHAQVGGRTLALDVSLIDSRTLSLLTQGNSLRYSISGLDNDKVRISHGSHTWDAEVKSGSGGTVHAARRSAKKGRVPVLAPMPGKVLRVLCKEGDRVKAGDCISIIEAMKMENEIKCPKDGLIAKVEAREGDIVDSGETLLIVDDPA
ncbi:MAG: biotin/lipoyl-binding protein [Nitrospirae bacterium]|nr:biotin/lipoyl-binding protein [Nitrospirota bacterium]